MAKSEIFVGRKEELKEFKKVLEDPRGQAIIVTGNRGMGKTWLVNRMAKLASEHPTLKCGWVRYEVTPTDSPDSTMAIMMDNALEAAQITEGTFDGTRRRLEQWRSFFNVFNLGDLVMSLRRDPARNTREQFLERLNLISKKMSNEGRAIFIIDPEKYMQKESDQTWAIVVKSLPEKIKFIFAQRTEDALVGSEVIDGLDKVVWIPSKNLDSLSEEDVDELVNCRRVNLKVDIPELKKVLSRYKGHPYAVGAVLDLVEQGTKLEELPKKAKPVKFAELQWKKICDESGEEAIRLFKGHAILEAAVPDDVVGAVSKVSGDMMQYLLANKFISGLLREEGGGRRIYHSVLADYILGQMSKDENTEYHKRAVEVYRGKLKKAKEEQTKPDEQAVVRLPEHVLEAEGRERFIKAFINECTGPLTSLGLLDEAISLSERALGIANEDSREKAMVLDNLGLIYQTRGNLEMAEEMHNKSLEISEKFGWLGGMASNYGNLGLIHQIRANLDKAEEMHKRALEINERIGRLEGMANQYGNLGLIYQIRGDLNKAVEMFGKVLDIEKQLGRPDSIANALGNLGLIYQMRGDLDKAEDMLKRGLEIDERIGRLEGMASGYAALGVVCHAQDDLKNAERWYLKGLEIEKKIGRLEGIARQYANLGVVYRERGDYKNAREYWQKAQDLYKKIGMTNKLKKVEGWIEEIKEK